MTSSAPETRLIAARVRGRVLVRPAKTARPIGHLLGFHGYLESAATQLARLEEIPGCDAWTLVSVQGLHRVYRGRSNETVASWMTSQDRDVMIADNLAYVQAVADDLGIRGGTMPIVCAGFSQGGAMAFRAAVRGGLVASGIICIGADVPPELMADDSTRFPPVLFVRGARDEWLTQEKFDADAAALRARGADLRALVIDAGHEWTIEASRAAAEFLREAGRH
jgi:predicted esterase